MLAVVAFAVRWPNLRYIPQFTDEVFDAQVSYGIWEGKRPLIGVNAYTGAFYYYVLAGLFWLFGPSIYLPRLLVLVLGIGAVLATGLLGADLGRRAARGAERRRRAGGRLDRRAGGRRAAGDLGGPRADEQPPGLAALHAAALPDAGVLAGGAGGGRLRAPTAQPPPPRTGQGEHGRIGSPLLAGAGSGGEVCPGLGAGGGRAAVRVGPAAAPDDAAALAGLPGVRRLAGWAYFRTRWAYAAMLAFLVGISPLILYNLVATDFGTLKESQEQTSGYQEGRDKDFSYRGRAIEIAQTLPRIVASAVDLRPSARSRTYCATRACWRTRRWPWPGWWPLLGWAPGACRWRW